MKKKYYAITTKMVFEKTVLVPIDTVKDLDEAISLVEQGVELSSIDLLHEEADFETTPSPYADVNGLYKLSEKDAECYCIIKGDNIFKHFENGQQMYEYLTSGTDLYSKSLGIYVFEYNDAHALCTYRLQPEKVVELIRLSEENGGFWSEYLGTGGSILDSSEYNDVEHRYSEDENMTALYLQPSFDFCEEVYQAEDWMDVNEVTEEFVKGRGGKE